MKLNKVHYYSSVVLVLFVSAHLINHVWSIFGAAVHIEMMNRLRVVYRNVVVESILLGAVVLQIVSGIRLVIRSKDRSKPFFDKLQLLTGIYLSFFLLFHTTAVLVGRWVLELDTNFYFGVAGLNTFPFSLFFVPYYTMAIMSFFGHLAAIHDKKMRYVVLGLSPSMQSKLILMSGILVSVVILYGATNHFQVFAIPAEYGVIIGK